MCTEFLSQATGEIEPPRRSREPAVGPHHADGESHCSKSSIRGKALPAGAASRARDQSLYSGMGMPFSVKIDSSS